MRRKMSIKMTNDNFLFLKVIGKKNTQTSVSDADHKIPTLESTENAGNSVNLFPTLSVYPGVRISLSESETDDRFYFSITCTAKWTLLPHRLDRSFFNIKGISFDTICKCSSNTVGPDQTIFGV